MPFVVEQNCNCCRRAIALNEDGYHCRYCWDKYHNGLRDNDFITFEEWQKQRKDFPKFADTLKKIMDKNKVLLKKLGGK
jgi:hypothetical protein